MPLGYVEVAAPVLVDVLLILGIIVTGGIGMGLLLDLVMHKQPFYKRIIFFPIPQLASRLRKSLQHWIASLSHRALLSEPAAAKYIRRQSAHLEQLTGVIGATNLAIYQALVYVRKTLVPTLIERAVAPVRTTANTALKEERAIKVQLDTARGYITSGLKKLPWGTAATFELDVRQWMGAFVQLWTQFYAFRDDVWKPWLATVFAPLKTRVDYIWKDLYDTGKDGLESIRARLATLEKGVLTILEDPTTWVLAALGLAAVPALSAGGMRTALQSLTCRNTQTVAREICAMDEALLAELLAGTLLFSLLLDPREVVSVGTLVEEAIGDAWRTMAL